MRRSRPGCEPLDSVPFATRSMTPFHRRPLRALIALFLALGFAGVHAADDYPSKPIRLVVPYPAGGIADKIARETAEQLQQRLKQSVVVENRSGAAGNIG